MLGREPRLGHVTLRWLIILLMLINGLQIVLLQGAINSSALGEMGQTWAFVAGSGLAFIASAGIIAYAFVLGRKSAK